jgi:hypothetical protein
MTESSPMPQAVPGPQASPDVPEPVPGMVMGDAAVPAARRHGLRATLFIAFIYLMAAISGVAFVAFAYSAASSGDLVEAGWALGVGVWAVLQWRLADEVRRFSRWGWYGAMAALSVALGTKLFWAFVLRDLAYFFLSLLIVDALLLHYFWTRRDQFDVSFGG